MLVLVPTELEAEPLKGLPLEMVVIGMGPVEAGLTTLEVLRERRPPVVFLVGLAGAYPDTELAPGDLVVAAEEIFGDLALCLPDSLSPFSQDLPVVNRVSLRTPWLERILALLSEGSFEVECGPCVTVCCATRDPGRALLFRRRHAALAENMEGFAVARATQRLGLSLVEIRSVSNLLENPEDPWETEKALARLREVLSWLARNFK